MVASMRSRWEYLSALAAAFAATAISVAASLLLGHRRALWKKTSTDDIGTEEGRATLPGLRNRKNACFFNALLQALASCPEVLTSLEAVIDEASDLRGIHLKLEVSSKLISLLSGLMKVYSRPTVLKSSELMEELRRSFGPLFDEFGEQEDSLEALTLLRTAVESEFFPLISSPLSKGLLDVLEERTSTERTPFHPSSREAHALASYFWALDGSQISLTTCRKCGYVFTAEAQPCLYISLSLGSSRSSLQAAPTVQTLLHALTAAELVEGVMCPGCSHSAAATVILRALTAATVARARLQLHGATSGSSGDGEEQTSQAVDGQHHAESMGQSIDSFQEQDSLAVPHEPPLSRDSPSGLSTPSLELSWRSVDTLCSSLKSTLGVVERCRRQGDCSCHHEFAKSFGSALEESMNQAQEFLRVMAPVRRILLSSVWPTVKCTVSRKTLLGKLPKVAFLHIARLCVDSSGCKVKLQDHVPFPPFLDLRPYSLAGQSLGTSSSKLSGAAPGESNASSVECSAPPHSHSLNHPAAPRLMSSLARVGIDTTRSTSARLVHGDHEGSGISASDLLQGELGLPSAMHLEPADPVSTGCPEHPMENHTKKLAAVLVHHGGPDSGHYSAYRRLNLTTNMDSNKLIGDPEDMWFWISDDLVERVQLPRVLCAPASVLVYA